MATNWRTGEFASIPDECLDCLRQVEVVNNNTKPDGCVEHNAWQKVHPSERTVCGPYAITQFYFDFCKERDKSGILTRDTFKACALEENCARSCVKLYVEADQSSCGRSEIFLRKCIDFGIIHANRQGACNQRETNTDIITQADVIKKTCKVDDLARTLPEPRPTEGPTKVNVVAIVVPIISVLLVLGLLVGVVIWYLKYYRKRHNLDEEGKSRAMNMYITEGRSGLASNFNYDNCSQEILEMLQARKVAIEDLNLKEEIGKGQFGVIRKADLYTDPERQQKIVAAVKMIRANQITEDNINDILREAHIMYHFDHPNVLGIIGVVWSKGDPPLVVLPYMGKGSLLELVRKEDVKFTPTDLLNFIVQIAAGLEYLERLKFVHRDIALRNCLVSDYFVVKIGDFGLSRDVYDTGIYDCDVSSDKKFDIREKRLPWKWLAPECMKEGLFTHKSDVWAFGILIWELYNSGRPPYPAMANLTVLQECLEAGYRLSKPDKLQEEIYAMMRVMWIAEPSARPSFSQIHQNLQTLIQGHERDISYDYTFDAENQAAKLLRQKFPPSRTASCESADYADNKASRLRSSFYE